MWTPESNLTPQTVQVADATGKVDAEQRILAAERRAQQAEQRYRALASAIGEWLWTTDAEGKVDTDIPQGRVYTGQSQEEILGFGWITAIHPEDRAQTIDAWTLAIKNKTIYRNIQRVQSKDGTYRVMEVCGAPVFDETGAVESWVGVTRDITEYKQLEWDLRALQALTDTALTHLTVDHLLQALLERIRDIMHIDNVAILLLDDSKRQLVIRAVRGVEEEVADQVRVPIGQGFAGRIFATQQPLIVNDLSTYPVVNAFLGEHLRSILGVPLIVMDRCLGVIHISTADPHIFTQHDMALLNLAADRAALAIDRAQQFEAAQQAHEQTQKHAADLEREQIRWRLAMEEAPEYVATCDNFGQITYQNPAFAYLIGQSRLSVQQDNNGVVGNTELFLPRSLPLFRALMENQTVQDVELQHHYPEGEKRVVAWNASPMRTPTGEIFGAITIGHDITEYRRVEQAFALQVKQLESVFEAMTDGVILYDKDGQIIRTNTQARALFGLDSSLEFTMLPLEVRGKTLAITDIQGHSIPIEQWPGVRLLKGESLTEENAIDFAVHNLTGEDLILNYVGSPIFDNRGSVSGAVMVVRNVTESRRTQRQTREALQAMIDMVHLLVEPSPDFSLADKKQQRESRAIQSSRPTSLRSGTAIPQKLAQLTSAIIGCKRVGLTIIEPETEQLRAIAVSGLSTEQEQQWWEEQQAQEAQGNRFGEGGDPEEVARFRAGEVFVQDMRIPPLDTLPNPYGITTMLVAPMLIDGQLIGMLTLDHGGIPHKYTQEEQTLARATGQLAAFVIERERMIHERMTAEANAMALTQANNQMKTFLGIVSHELKTPLTTLKANHQLTQRRIQMLQTDDPIFVKSIEPMVKRASSSIQRMERLINELLDISRIQEGKFYLDKRSCDLREIVQDAVDEIRLQHDERLIHCDFPSEPVLVIGDRDRLWQVVNNYLSNALKYSLKDRPVSVKISIKKKKVRVAILDEGPGLSKEESKRVWELFHRAPGIEVLTGSGVGLGLGLYISKTIIEYHAGKVGVESIPGKGSTFWFTLPLEVGGIITPMKGSPELPYHQV
jgi:PAS domain S-box-containing protein